MRFGQRGGPGTNDPGRFTCENCNLVNLVTTAYAIRGYQLIAPAWLSEQRFDLAAKISEGTTKEQFKNELSGYELSLAKGGSKLKESAEDPAKDDAPRPVARAGSP